MGQPLRAGASNEALAPTSSETCCHIPIGAQSLRLLFPVIAGLAFIAALGYFGVTLLGHLGAGLGAAP